MCMESRWPHADCGRRVGRSARSAPDWRGNRFRRSGVTQDTSHAGVIWLFPVTYLFHIAEEYWGGFAQWFSTATGVHATNEAVLLLNGIGLAVMTISVVLVSRSRKWRWVLTAIAGIVVVNALLHAAGSVLARSYSPGLVSGLLLWMPLGCYTLWREWRSAARSTFVKGVIGVGVFHALIGAALI